MSELNHYRDTPRQCYANLKLSDASPCFISIAQTGVLVKKSKTGLFGAQLNKEKDVYRAAMTAKALAYLFPETKVPDDISNIVLKAFTNAALHCTSAEELTLTLNEAVSRAESASGRVISEL